MPDIPKLNYAPPPPMHRRQIFRRWIYTAVLMCIVASGWWWTPPAWRRVQVLYWQHRCMVYAAPKDKVVLRASPLILLPGGIDRHAHASPIIPEEWSRYYRLISPPGLQSDGTLFLHELRKNSGESRLVAVDINSNLPDGGHSAFARVIFPGSLVHPPAQSARYCDYYIGSDDSEFIAFAGCRDPTDASHFTFRIISDSQDRTFDGWLQSDDSVVIGERKSRFPKK